MPSGHLKRSNEAHVTHKAMGGGAEKIAQTTVAEYHWASKSDVSQIVPDLKPFSSTRLTSCGMNSQITEVVYVEALFLIRLKLQPSFHPMCMYPLLLLSHHPSSFSNTAPVVKPQAIFGPSKYGQAISYSCHVPSDVNDGSFTQSGKNNDYSKHPYTFKTRG